MLCLCGHEEEDHTLLEGARQSCEIWRCVCLFFIDDFDVQEEDELDDDQDKDQ